MAPYFFSHFSKKRRKLITGCRRAMTEERKRHTFQGNPDRLSDLPDSLIIRILSLLEMTDVVRTSILSKRWKDLWTGVYNIVYNCIFHGDEPESEEDISLEDHRQYRGKIMKLYISFIHNTLTQCVSNIREFSLSGFGGFSIVFFNNTVVNALVDEWVEYVLVKKVEILKLDYDGLFHRVPDSLYRCSSLTQLKLSTLTISLWAPTNWPLLKTLSLKRICVRDEYLENILLGCPVLESLVLDEVSDLNHLSIMSPSVKKLKLFDIQYEDSDVDDILEIRVPFLQELEISGRFIVRNCVIVDVSSLLKATLKFTTYLPSIHDDHENVEEIERILMEREYNFGWINMVAGLLKSLCHVGELLIGSELLQVLSISSLLGRPCPSFKCKHVQIVSPLWKYDLLGIVYLLEGMPHLETLVLNVFRWTYVLPLAQIEEFLSDTDPQLSFPKGNFLHLKNVKIGYRMNPFTDNAKYHQIGGKCIDFELLVYILRSCVALERLVLCALRHYCYRTKCLKSCCELGYVHHLSSKLLMDFLPANKDAEWELKKRRYAFEYRFSNYASMRFED